jgi:hypothetical protein
VDTSVRNAVKAKVHEVGGDPKRLEGNWPTLTTKTGKQIPIHRARVWMRVAVTKIGMGNSQRYVTLADNHHVEIVESTTSQGNHKWEAPIVSRLEAFRRKEKGLPLVAKKLASARNSRFLFSLMKGDIVEMDDLQQCRRNLFVVRNFSDGNIGFVRHTEARQYIDLKKGANTTADLVCVRSLNTLKQLGCRKVFVDVLGRVRS